MLERTFDDLCLKLGHLRTALRAVQVAAAADRPSAAATRDMLLALDQVAAAADRARRAARLPVDIDAARRAMPRCQRQFSLLKQGFYAGLGSDSSTETLLAEGREETVFYLRRCHGPMFAAESALGACWRALGLYSATNPGGAIPGFVPPA